MALETTIIEVESSDRQFICRLIDWLNDTEAKQSSTVVRCIDRKTVGKPESLEVQRLRERIVQLTGSASGLAGYASTCKTTNLLGWMEGLANRINSYNATADDPDRVVIQHGRLIRLDENAAN